MNSMAFTPEDMKKGLGEDLIKYLLDLNSKLQDRYMDIHITTDGYCTIFEWDEVSFEFGGGKFMYVGEDDVVMKALVLPDHSTRYVLDDEEAKTVLAEYEQEHKKE